MGQGTEPNCSCRSYAKGFLRNKPGTASVRRLGIQSRDSVFIMSSRSRKAVARPCLHVALSDTEAIITGLQPGQSYATGSHQHLKHLLVTQ